MSSNLEAFRKQHAFSLVELSIVLVILGLLTGGVLTGQSLIRASELRAVTTEYNKYISVVQSFRDKYMALPGDMTNAQSFWGVAHATPATCVTTASTTATTCNGNGDGIVFPSTGSNELYRFWQHLANAGLIEGQYNGITQGATNYSSTAVNVPKSKISNGYWSTYNWGTQTSNGTVFDGVYNNLLMVGSLVTDNFSYGAIFKPEELWNIDTKMDDGKPAIGRVVMVGTFNACTTASASTTLTADYLLTATSQACGAIFRQAF